MVTLELCHSAADYHKRISESNQWTWCESASVSVSTSPRTSGGRFVRSVEATVSGSLSDNHFFNSDRTVCLGEKKFSVLVDGVNIFGPNSIWGWAPRRVYSWTPRSRKKKKSVTGPLSRFLPCSDIWCPVCARMPPPHSRVSFWRCTWILVSIQTPTHTNTQTIASCTPQKKTLTHTCTNCG